MQQLLLQRFKGSEERVTLHVELLGGGKKARTTAGKGAGGGGGLSRSLELPVQPCVGPVELVVWRVGGGQLSCSPPGSTWSVLPESYRDANVVGCCGLGVGGY